MKTFLFDLYGTLLDIKTDEWSDAFWERISRLLQKDIADAAEIKRAYHALCEAESAKLPPLAEIDLTQVFARLLAEFGVKNTPILQFAREFRKASVIRCRPFAEAKSILGGLKMRGAKVFLLSNAQACFTHDEIDEAGLRAYFDGVMLSSEVGYKKPSPHFFAAAFARYALSPADCVYVGNDLRDDVGGANGVGMRSVYIETEQSGRYTDAPIPDMVVSDFVELKKLLFRLAEK